jgi:hypothetical protein
MAPTGIFCFADDDWASWSGKDRLYRTQICLGHAGEVQAGDTFQDCGLLLPNWHQKDGMGELDAPRAARSPKGISCACTTGCGGTQCFLTADTDPGSVICSLLQRVVP